MLKPIKFANAATIIAVVCYIIYMVVLIFTPQLIHTYAESMYPGYDMSVIRATDNITIGFILTGLVSIALSVWVLVFTTIWLYNRLSR